VLASAGRLFWPCSSVWDLNIYLPYQFEWISTKNKKVSNSMFYCAKMQTHVHVHAFSGKKWLSFGTSTNARLSSWKVSYWFLEQFLRTFTDRKVPENKKIDWLIDWLFTVLRLAQEYFTYMETSSLRAAKFRSMLGAQGLWAGRGLYRATSAATQGLCFSGLLRRTAPFSCLLRRATGCGKSILTWIPTGPHYITSYKTQGDVKDLF
jgi:hypothetical protein